MPYMDLVVSIEVTMTTDKDILPTLASNAELTWAIEQALNELPSWLKVRSQPKVISEGVAHVS